MQETGLPTDCASALKAIELGSVPEPMRSLSPQSSQISNICEYQTVPSR